MFAAATLLFALTFSILITRVATIALSHTGLSRESSRFQARSAFTGVGFTTSESEKMVNHPVRRRILMFLMLVGNAGIVTVVSSVILTFVGFQQTADWLWRTVLLVVGLTLLWTASYSKWLDRRLSHLVARLLRRYTDLDVRDYAHLLHLGGEYIVSELQVQAEDWMAGQSLAALRLRDEGVVVLGIQRRSGEYAGVPDGDSIIEAGDVLLVYGRGAALERLDERSADWRGELEHRAAVEEQEIVKEEERAIMAPDSGAGTAPASGATGTAGD